jgi:hypothetical protein
METTTVKTTRKRVVNSPRPIKTKRVVSDDDIRRRAYEIYRTNGISAHTELDDWLKAERELKGSGKY